MCRINRKHILHKRNVYLLQIRSHNHSETFTATDVLFCKLERRNVSYTYMYAVLIGFSA